MQSSTRTPEGSLTRTRILGGHYIARKLDVAYGAYLVFGITMGLVILAESITVRGTALWRTLSFFGVLILPTAVPAGLLALWCTLKHLTHWPLPLLATLGGAAIFAAVTLDQAGHTTALAWVGPTLAAIYVLAPSYWFFVGRREFVTSRFTRHEFSYAGRQAVCISLIFSGVALWPLLWYYHFSEHGMGGWTGGPVTLIWLGFLPSSG